MYIITLMKIPVYDVQHIINQIKCASPPVTKEMHKLINNLSILLDKNIDKQTSPLETVLNSSLEQLNEKFLDLCFLRKDLVVKYGEEYSKIVSDIIKIISEDKEEKALPAYKMNDWALEVDCKKSCEIIPEIFSKLKKAKEVIEDAIGNKVSNTTVIDADMALANYINGAK